MNPPRGDEDGPLRINPPGSSPLRRVWVPESMGLVGDHRVEQSLKGFGPPPGQPPASGLWRR